MAVDIIFWVVALLTIAIAATAIYGSLRIHAPSRKLPVQGQQFPDGFLWGSGEDAYQHEGGNLNNDWARWEAGKPSPIENGDICGRSVDFFNRYEDDFELAKRDGQNMHRIGIEWSRVEPQMGVYDVAAWDHYEAMLVSLKNRGFMVFFNIWHFTLPLWAVDMGGWENNRVMERWEAFVKECAVRFGKYVDYWSTMIDSQIYALSGYGLGDIPPNKKDLALAVQIYRTLIHAHARAYHIIKEHGGAEENGMRRTPKVGIIYFFFHYQPKGFFMDSFVVSQTGRIFNWNFLDAVYSGVIDINVFLGPSAREKDDGLKGTLDWIGVNYYTREVLSFNPLKPGMVDRTSYSAYPVSDMGWEIYPEGIYHICKMVARRYKDLPIIITECGLADSRDDRRPWFILDHLSWVHRLVKEGCPIIGFAYWSLTDNWEWARGFAQKFGLYRVDRVTLERSETSSARLYRYIAQNNRLPQAHQVTDLLTG